MSFDPYHAWLDIPPGERPPNHYVLLGLPLYESDSELIEDAAKSRIDQVRSRATWERSAETQAVITQLHRARCLLTRSVRKAFYDLSLRAGSPHDVADSASEQPLTTEFAAASEFASVPDLSAVEEEPNRIDEGQVDEEHVDLWHPFPVGGRCDFEEQTADAATLSLHDLSGLVPARGPESHPLDTVDTASCGFSDPPANSVASRRASAPGQNPHDVAGPEANAHRLAEDVTAAPRDPLVGPRSLSRIGVLARVGSQWFSSRPRTAAAIASISAIVVVCVLLFPLLDRNGDNSPNGQMAQISDASDESDDDSPNSAQHAQDSGERGGVSPPVIAKHADSPGGLRHPARQDLIAAEQPVEPAPTVVAEPLVAAAPTPHDVPLPEADKAEQPVPPPSQPSNSTAATPAAPVSDATVPASAADPAPPSQEALSVAKPLTIHHSPNTIHQPPLHDISNAADRDQYVKLIRDMLQEGFLPDNRALPVAVQHFNAAQKIFARDAYLPFGYGLVLWRHLKYDEALTQFQASTRTGDELFVPGWQASIRGALARKQTETALARMLELSRLLDRHAADASNAESVRQYAEWIGRIVGFLEQPTNALAADLDVVADCRRQIQDVLRDELLTGFEQGRSDVAREYAENMNAAERAVSELEDEQKAQREQTQRTLAKKIDAGEDQAEALTRTANEWKDWIDGQTRELDQQLGKLADEFQKTFHQAQAVSTAIDRANSEIFSREQQAASRQAAVKLPDPTLTSLAKRRDELRTQYDLLERQGTQLQQQGTATLEKRRQAVAAYQKATGKLVEESETLRKWQDTLTKQSRRQQNQPLPGQAKANALKRHATALSTYVDFDLATEKERLLAAFSHLQNP